MSEIKVIYWSQSGNTMSMANAVAEGIKEAGKEAAVLEVSAVTAADLNDETVFALGCPAMGAEELEETDERMERQYVNICKKHNCKAKVFTRMKGNLKDQIGSPDLIVLFTNTVCHKMVKCALAEAERCNANVIRCHTSSQNALEEILAGVNA